MKRVLGLLATIALGCSTSSSPGAAQDAGVDGTQGDAVAPVTFDDGGEAGDAPSLFASDASVYLGQPAALSAAVAPPVAGVHFAWELTKAPPGSAITSASLGAADQPALTFTPDLAGEYDLKVTASGPFGATSTAVAVQAYAAPVFYTRATFDTNGGEVAVYVAGTDGSGEHAVACAITFNSNESANYRTRTLFAAATAADAWEAPAGGVSRFVFSGTDSLTQDDAGAFSTFLIAGTTSNSCTSVPNKLRALQAPAGALGQPRFSADGSRIAFVDPAGSSFGISTIGFDGSGYRAIAPIYAGGTPPQGSADESTNIRPEWQDDTHLGWARPKAGGWDLVIASDVAGAAVTPLMTCAGASTPHHVAFVSDGSIVAAYAPTANAPVDLFVLKPGAGGACTVVRNLTKLTGAASRAHDYALSPDGSTVAFLRYDASKNDGGASSGNDGELYVAPIDGSAAPKPIGGAPLIGRIGPRWVAGGAQLAITRARPSTAVADGGDVRLADDVVVLAADGGAPRALASGDAVNVVVGAVGPGGSCSLSRSANASPFGAVLAGLALLVARARRRLLRKP